ncbi:hypothetical protein L7F22_037820 [Adiantum nelumboides]|nr:hypothetical protein [Adiantum nelumboides]
MASAALTMDVRGLDHWLSLVVSKHEVLIGPRGKYWEQGRKLGHCVQSPRATSPQGMRSACEQAMGLWQGRPVAIEHAEAQCRAQAVLRYKEAEIDCGKIGESYCKLGDLQAGKRGREVGGRGGRQGGAGDKEREEGVDNRGRGQGLGMAVGTQLLRVHSAKIGNIIGFALVYNGADGVNWAIAFEIGRALHGEVHCKDLSLSLVTGNTLIRMYGSCGAMAHAMNAFYGLTKPDIVSKTAILSHVIVQGQDEKALQSYCKLSQEEIGSNHQTFLMALQACGKLAEKEEGCTLADGEFVKENSLEIG